MKALPDGFDAGRLERLLAEGWGLETANLEYAPVGAGSYHWVVEDADGLRRFVTVDDLERKPWLGDGREEALAGLRQAFETAVELARAGLEFVVAPIPTTGGEALHRVDARYTVALFPFLDGARRSWGRWASADERAPVVDMLARLHRATPAVEHVARKAEVDVPGRRRLEAGLYELDRPWTGGPFSEPAREALAAHAPDVADLLALADRLAAGVASRDAGWVVTHGEPHTANVLASDGGLAFVDWDTVALAPPERDLWMVVETTDEARAYADATGREVNETALSFYRLSWDLGDLAAYLDELRSPHGENEDTAKGYRRLCDCVSSRDRWAPLLG